MQRPAQRPAVTQRKASYQWEKVPSAVVVVVVAEVSASCTPTMMGEGETSRAAAYA